MDISRSYNQRSQIILDLIKTKAFLPVALTYKNVAEGDFTRVPNRMLAPNAPRTKSIQLEFRKGMDKRWREIPLGNIYLISVNNPGKSVKRGVVIHIDVERAAVYIQNGTHMVATSKQVHAWALMQRQQQIRFEQDEIIADPVKYAARKKAQLSAANYIQAQTEYNEAMEMDIDRSLYGEVQTDEEAAKIVNFLQPGDDWKEVQAKNDAIAVGEEIQVPSTRRRLPAGIQLQHEPEEDEDKEDEDNYSPHSGSDPNSGKEAGTLALAGQGTRQGTTPSRTGNRAGNKPTAVPAPTEA